MSIQISGVEALGSEYSTTKPVSVKTGVAGGCRMRDDGRIQRLGFIVAVWVSTRAGGVGISGVGACPSQSDTDAGQVNTTPREGGTSSRTCFFTGLPDFFDEK